MSDCGGGTQPRTSRSMIVGMAAIALLLGACGKKQENLYPSFEDRGNVPILHTTHMESMISDSGVTRYRVEAEDWLVYDKADTPYWDFPKGARFERFDNDLKTDASIEADSVVYYSKEKLWRLSGHVKANNLKHEEFETELLFWDQESKRIYTDEEVKITQSDKQLTGYGFESNQTFSVYSLRNVKAIIPL